MKIDNLNLITSDFVFSVSYVPLPAWNVKIFLSQSLPFHGALPYLSNYQSCLNERKSLSKNGSPVTFLIEKSDYDYSLFFFIYRIKGKARSLDAKLAKATKWLGAVFVVLTLVLNCMIAAGK